eukprot:1733208-Prymnesium_polylepis.1
MPSIARWRTASCEKSLQVCDRTRTALLCGSTTSKVVAHPRNKLLRLRLCQNTLQARPLPVARVERRQRKHDTSVVPRHAVLGRLGQHGGDHAVRCIILPRQHAAVRRGAERKAAVIGLKRSGNFRQRLGARLEQRRLDVERLPRSCRRGVREQRGDDEPHRVGRRLRNGS